MEIDEKLLRVAFNKLIEKEKVNFGIMVKLDLLKISIMKLAITQTLHSKKKIILAFTLCRKL